MADRQKSGRKPSAASLANLKANAGRGRPKGIKNKMTILAKEAIAQVADGLGGVDRMIAWAKEDEANERVFWSSIYTKLIPVQTELTGKDGGAIRVEQETADAAQSFTSRLLSGIAAAAAGSGTGDTQH